MDEPEDSRLTEISHTQKDNYCIIPLICAFRIGTFLKRRKSILRFLGVGEEGMAVMATRFLFWVIKKF